VIGPEATREQILALERRRLRSLVEPDLEIARSLHSRDYQLITPSGATYSRDQYLGEIESGVLDYSVFEPEDEAHVAVRIVIGGAAVRYVARIVVSFADGTDRARVWHTDLWERGEEGWQATWSQATRLPSGGD
jgi:hypothetical protein